MSLCPFFACRLPPVAFEKLYIPLYKISPTWDRTNRNDMSLTEKISADLITAMKVKDKVALEAIRAVKTAFIMFLL